MKTLILVSLVSVILISCQDKKTSFVYVDNHGLSQQDQHLDSVIQSLMPADGFEGFGKVEGDRSFHSNLLFYEVVLSYGPIDDPRPVFLLANAYIINQQQQIGIAYFERLFGQYRDQMTPQQASTYLAAYALIRASYADKVRLYKRIGWMNKVFELLEEAEQSDAQNPLVHWSAGMIYAQVPWFLNKEEKAIEELLWLVERPEMEPTKGFYREVYHALSTLYASKGEDALAESYLEKSGYNSYDPKVLFTGWFSTTKKEGLTFSPGPWLEEVIPDRVFSLRGFGFSDLNFVVSKDGKELISIDAGTQPYSYKEGYEYLLTKYPDLPPLTTLLITHSHWDHIGGYTYLKRTIPGIQIYGRENFHGTLERIQRNHVYKQFRGSDFDFNWVKDYNPDEAISEVTNITIGGSTIELIPVTGGETEDAMLLHFPELRLMFMGDALMPFYGEPWTEEGFIDEAVNTMDEALKRNPKVILHGHVGINVLYQDPKQLRVFRNHFEWLVKNTRHYVSNGYSVKDIIRMNLIPPGLEKHPYAFMSFISPRDHLISRTADRMIGIWSEEKSGKEPAGLDVVTSIEYGRLLDLYLGLNSREVEELLENILSNGDNELALKMAVAAEKRYSDNQQITAFKEEAGDRLRSEIQFFDPFKFVVYTELIDKEHEKVSY